MAAEMAISSEEMEAAIRFNDRENIMLDPAVFRYAIQELQFMPSIDVFASHAHHQVPRYFSKAADPCSAGKDAFHHKWSAEEKPYINTHGLS